MLAEVLLLLSGHSSTFFVTSPSSSTRQSALTVSPHLADYLHPGEVASLNSLALLAHRYRTVKSWAEDVQRQGRAAVLSEHLGRKGKSKPHARHDALDDPTRNVPNTYLTDLAGGLLEILTEYEVLIVRTEARILASDPTFVQDSAAGYVPLSNIVATFDKWQAPLASLAALVDRLSSTSEDESHAGILENLEDQGEQKGAKEVWTPGRLLDLITEKAQTGNPFIEKVYLKILSSLIHLFLTHLISFLLYGLAPTTSSPTSPSIVLDVGADPSSPKYRIYKLNVDLLPSCIGGRTKESILYVGRVAATLKREGRALPKSLVDGVREAVMAVTSLDEVGGLGEAIQRARAEVGEWLWRHILTGPQIAEAIESFADIFLTRKSDYALSLLREIARLRLDKLVLGNPHSSSSVIREQDLDLVLLRASVGTSAETDTALDSLRFKMPRGPLRALLPLPGSKASKGDQNRAQVEGQDTGGSTSNSSSIRGLFSSMILGTPIELVTSITWPLDLFLSPTSLSLYSDINAYLLSLRDTHLRVQETWTSLSGSQRRRRVWTGANEGGSSPPEVEGRRRLVRVAWGTIRLMGWWLDQLIGHFMDDIIDVQHRRLLEQLELVDGREPGLTGSVRGSSLRRSVGLGIGRSKSPALGPGPAQPPRTTPGANTGYTPSASASAFGGGGGGRPQSPLSETHTWGEGTVGSNRAPPTPTKMGGNYLDFLTLRQIHARHLSFLREGLLLSDPSAAGIIRDILLVCRRFTGLVERWGGDVVPPLFEEGEGEGTESAESSAVGGMVREREGALREINENLRDLLLEFFGALLDTQNPGISNAEADKSKSGAGISISRTRQISRMMRSTSFRGRSKSGKLAVGAEDRDKQVESEVVLSKHVEQLLLRLDFNGVLTQWKMEEDGDGQGQGRETMGSILPEGGL